MASNGPEGMKKQLQLQIALSNIVKLDLLSLSDPMVVVYLKDLNGREIEIGRTEMIPNVKNCQFAKMFQVDYFFEEIQTMRFAVYDVDGPVEGPLSGHDFVGSVDMTLGQIIGMHRGKFSAELVHPQHKNRGTISVTAEEVGTEGRGFISFSRCRGAGLDRKNGFGWGSSDPFLEFARQSDRGDFSVVYKTDVIKKNLDPSWPPFQIPLRVLCNGQWERPIRISCWDWNASGRHELIGEAMTTCRKLVSDPNHTLDLIHPDLKAKKKNYKNSGTLSTTCAFEEDHSFVEYLASGYDLQFFVGVDFTGSNGDPRLPSSLHYMDPRAPNQYAQAISAVGAVIQDYDSDNLFPALGFGAKFPDGAISHNFSLTGDYRNPYCQGIAGVLAAYQRTLSQVTLWGPTNFAPIINHVADIAAGQARDANSYTVLLMITDGAITDMADTEEAIVRAASLPMSIIIIGVGPADFSLMERLDGDKERISSKGIVAERDIVQFVPFRDFSGPHAGHLLAKEVLAELPDQFEAYMRARKIRPAARAAVPAEAPPPYM